MLLPPRAASVHQKPESKTPHTVRYPETTRGIAPYNVWWWPRAALRLYQEIASARCGHAALAAGAVGERRDQRQRDQRADADKHVALPGVERGRRICRQGE